MPTYKQLLQKQHNLEIQLALGTAFGKDVTGVRKQYYAVTAELSARQSFPEALKEKREKMGWTKTELSRRTGVSVSSLSGYESGWPLPTKKSFEKLKSVFPDLPDPNS